MISELSDAQIDQIVFAMENQEETFLVDLDTGDLIRQTDLEISASPQGEDAAGRGNSLSRTDESSNGSDEVVSRYERVPQWRSVDGFNLMERFAGKVRNPIVRERLSEVLASGKGVFRGFKDVLKQYPPIERRWFSFKRLEMQRVVLGWFNSVLEAAGLQAMELPEFETDDLVHTDFLMRPLDPAEADLVASLDKDAFPELFPDSDDELVAYMYRRKRLGMPHPGEDVSNVFVAESNAGDFAGFVWTFDEAVAESRHITNLLQLYVLPEYRGLGLARSLIRRALMAAQERDSERMFCELPGEAQVMADLLDADGFELDAQLLSRELDSWSATG